MPEANTTTKKVLKKGHETIVSQVQKRDGLLVPFDKSKIVAVAHKAMKASE